jgi:hypothetical protein
MARGLLGIIRGSTDDWSFEEDLPVISISGCLEVYLSILISEHPRLDVKIATLGTSEIYLSILASGHPRVDVKVVLIGEA